MSGLTLYELSLRKVAINLIGGIYKSCEENPFSVMPSKFVNDLMSAALNLQRANGLKAHDLEQLLTSGKLRELIIFEKYVNTEQLKAIRKVLYFLKSGCQELEILHLTGDIDNLVKPVGHSRSEVSKALTQLFINTPNLKDIHCCFRFDLKALRNCKTLRSVRLHFRPRQHWYEFLAKENAHFQPHKYLEFFTVCPFEKSDPIPYADVVVILRFCPALTSLGYIESSQVLSQLHGMGISPSELKLKHCYWRDKEYDWINSPSLSPDHGIHRVRDAILHYSMIEELDFVGCCLRSIPCLRSLRNLVLLNITCNDNASGVALNDALQAIGPQLKHLSLIIGSPVDLSLLLQNCHNLESLGIIADEFTGFDNSTVSLPKLQRFTFLNVKNEPSFKRVFRFLCECNQLTQLFLLYTPDFDDQTLYDFLERNSLSNLKVARLYRCGLTEHGFRELLLSAPQLEKIEIFSDNLHRNEFQRIISETNHKAQCNRGTLSEGDEFFGRHFVNVNCIEYSARFHYII